MASIAGIETFGLSIWWKKCQPSSISGVCFHPHISNKLNWSYANTQGTLSITYSTIVETTLAICWKLCSRELEISAQLYATSISYFYWRVCATLTIRIQLLIFCLECPVVEETFWVESRRDPLATLGKVECYVHLSACASQDACFN